MVHYVDPTVEDAAAIVEFYNRVGGETSYLSFEKDEYPLTVEQQINKIKAGELDSQQKMIVVKDDDGSIVAIGTMDSVAKFLN